MSGREGGGRESGILKDPLTPLSSLLQLFKKTATAIASVDPTSLQVS